MITLKKEETRLRILAAVKTEIRIIAAEAEAEASEAITEAETAAETETALIKKAAKAERTARSCNENYINRTSTADIVEAEAEAAEAVEIYTKIYAEKAAAKAEREELNMIIRRPRKCTNTPVREREKIAEELNVIIRRLWDELRLNCTRAHSRLDHNKELQTLIKRLAELEIK